METLVIALFVLLGVKVASIVSGWVCLKRVKTKHKKIMRQKILLTAALLFAVAAAVAAGGVAPATAAANANIVVTKVAPTDLSPGETKEVTLTVKNQVF